MKLTLLLHGDICSVNFASAWGSSSDESCSVGDTDLGENLWELFNVQESNTSKSVPCGLRKANHDYDTTEWYQSIPIISYANISCKKFQEKALGITIFMN